MNQKITLFLFSFFIYVSLSAQTILFEDDFESYTAGDRIAQASSMGWDTWSGTVGGAEDGSISTSQAASGSNSLYITGTNDVLLRVASAPLTSGRYKVRLKMYVNTNRYAYYNLLHEFDGSNSSWATQSYFRPDGNCDTDAGGGSAGKFIQGAGEWFDMTYIIDLDDDFSTFYHLENEVVSWKWSSGSFGSGTLNTFEALNFYAWNAEGDPGYYVDDIIIEEVEKPGEIIALEALINTDNQVELSWTAADSSEEYVLLNRGSELLRTVDTASLIAKPYPQLYNFKVGAHFNLDGYRFSEIVDLDLPGGKERDFVLFEVGTGTWCPNCPAAARGVDQLHSEGFKVGVIEYHEGGTDNYIIPPGTDRVNYYDISGFPTTFCDGELSVLGGSFSGNLFPTFEVHYNDRLLKRSLYSLDMDVYHLGDQEYRIEVESEELYKYFDSTVNLRIALIENHIQEAWQGLDELNFVLRDMYPDAEGIEFAFNASSETYEYTFELDDSYVMENCELVAFLQYDDTKEILNGDVLKLEDALSSTYELANTLVEIKPNPVVEYLDISGVNNGAAVIYSQDGKRVHQFSISGPDHRECIPILPVGAYIMQVETKDGMIAHKLIKK